MGGDNELLLIVIALSSSELRCPGGDMCKSRNGSIRNEGCALEGKRILLSAGQMVLSEHIVVSLSSPRFWPSEGLLLVCLHDISSTREDRVLFDLECFLRTMSLSCDLTEEHPSVNSVPSVSDLSVLRVRLALPIA